MKIVILGLSVTSSWGNGHATTYRSLIRGLAAAGHSVLFLERNAPWYEGNRDEAQPAGATTVLYSSLDELTSRFEHQVAAADLVIVGSFVPEGIEVGKWVTATARGVTAFYDIDTPVTLASLDQGSCEYLTRALVAAYAVYLSFTGGPALQRIEQTFGSPCARALYCSVDIDLYVPLGVPNRWDMGYLGTWSEDRQPGLDQLMLEPARRLPHGQFAVVGPQYPDTISWPLNVERVIHLSPRQHAEFYASQYFTLNITRDAMKAAGYSPSVRLFEAGACGVPIVSDWWEGLDSVFTPGIEVLISRDAEDTLRYLRDMTADARRRIGAAARQRVLAEHTSGRRAAQLVGYFEEAEERGTPREQGVRV